MKNDVNVTPFMEKLKKAFTLQFFIKCIVLIVFLAGFAGLIYYANYDKPGYYTTADSGKEFEVGKVLKVIDDKAKPDPEYENVMRGSQMLRIEILTGRYQGDVVDVMNYLSGVIYNVYLHEGDSVSLQILTTGENEYDVTVYNYNRSYILIAFILIFVLSLCIVGGKRGFFAVLGLLFTMVAFIFILVPLVLKGFPTLITTIAITSVTIFVSLYLLNGLHKKSVSAMIGTFAGVVFAGILAVIASWLCGISGFNMDEAESLFLVARDCELKIKDLLICGILIASLGAVMDVAMSIASAIDELHTVNSKLTPHQLFKSGMNIGRDAMGTMANTLILAFAGTSLNMMIFIYAYGVTYVQLINTDFIAVELIRGLSGTMGIIFTVPFVAFITSRIVSAHKHVNAKDNESDLNK